MHTAFDPVEAMASCRHEFGEHGGVNMSVEVSTTFTVMNASTLPDLFQGRVNTDGGCYLYGRHFNPTVYALSRQLAAMEDTGSAYCTASGISAIAATVLQLCASGDHIVASDTIYGGTFALLKQFLPERAGIHTTFVDIRDMAAVEQAFTDRTRILYTETVANPTLRVSDLPALSRIARAHTARLVVDNTFTPLIVTPARHGADIVLHSLTKFISGASDIIAGAICGPRDIVQSMMDTLNGSLMLLGPTMDPRVAFHLSLRLPHLGLRMIEHGRRTHEFARRLRALGVPANYPGLDDHPGHDTLRAMANERYGWGGLLTIDAGTLDAANALMETLQNEEQFGYMAVSLGYFDSLMSASAGSTSSELGEDALEDAGISPGLVRMSVGITGGIEERWAQLERACRAVGLVNDSA